ncbi:MAG TPA: type II secretion system protein GspM [Steroidobacteraceae bacterium]|nr:type II secretion system protein GspM [Steroidobacteraceae bacterium]
MDAIKTWFHSLAAREQRVVAIGAAAAVVLLLAGAWWPVERRVARLQQQVQTRRADLDWLQSIAPQLSELRARPAGAGGESLVVLADRVAHETGISRSLNTQAGSDGTLSVRLEQVAFDALLNWAGELVQRHGVRVVSASIDSGAAPGMVSATIVLQAS